MRVRLLGGSALVADRLHLDPGAANGSRVPQVSPAPLRLHTRAAAGRDAPWDGDLRRFAGLTVRALGAGAPGHVVLLVTDEAGRRLLWAPLAGPLPEAAVQALGQTPLTAALLRPSRPGSTEAGPAAAADPGLLLAHQLARLRAAGAVSAGTALFAVAPTGSPLQRDRWAARLAAWGVRAVADGEELTLDGAAPPTEPGVRLPPRTLVLGGSASGKSQHAELLLAAEPRVTYLATGPAATTPEPSPTAGEGPAADREWAARVAAHQARRPPWWHTVESERVAAELAGAAQPVLWDSVGSWLAGALDQVGAWQGADGWRAELAELTDGVVAAWAAATGPVVAVTEEVGLSLVPTTASGRLFADLLGAVNQRLAAVSERVVLVAAGRPLELPVGLA